MVMCHLLIAKIRSYEKEIACNDYVDRRRCGAACCHK